MSNNQQLVIIGGAEDKSGDCELLREFVRCAGGLEARIVVMTVATDLPREVGDDYTRVFERLGVSDIRIVDTGDREDADSPGVLKAIQEATGIFFTGGDQARITGTLKDTQADALLHERFAAAGVVIGGTSAGAAMMPETMIVDGDADTNPRVEIVKLEPGMNFLPGVIIDQHFAQRGRLGRLLAAVAQQPVDIGLGIDENTGIVVKGQEFEVVGAGAVTVVDFSEANSNLPEVLRDEDLALCNVKLHILPKGYRYSLLSHRQLQVESDRSSAHQSPPSDVNLRVLPQSA